jgi:hypothetical protein
LKECNKDGCLICKDGVQRWFWIVTYNLSVNRLWCRQGYIFCLDLVHHNTLVINSQMCILPMELTCVQGMVRMLPNGTPHFNVQWLNVFPHCRQYKIPYHGTLFLCGHWLMPQSIWTFLPIFSFYLSTSSYIFPSFLCPPNPPIYDI